VEQRRVDVSVADEHTVVVGGRILYLVGGASRVAKSVLAQRLLETEGIPWLPTDVLPTVLRRVVPELDAADHDPVDLPPPPHPHLPLGQPIARD
jgi:hypothetical protein